MLRIREVWKEEFKIEEYDDKTGKGCYVVGIQPPKHFNQEGHNYDRYNNIISFDNGAVVYIGSFDNYKALDGMEITWAILDETKDTKEEAVKEVIIGRLREKKLYVNKKGELTSEPTDAEPFNPLYIFSSPAKVQWINEWFELDVFEAEINSSIYSETTYFKKKFKNKFVTISSTYLNAANIPSNYIENQKMNLHSTLVDMLVYGNPFSKTGGEFYKCFDKLRHTGETKYNPALPIHLTFDFNVNPYVTCNVWQVEGKIGKQIDEICLPAPLNRTVDAVREFGRRYKGHKRQILVYGDPAGKHEDTRTERGFNDYRIITGELKKLGFESRDMVQNVAPAVHERADFINTIFEKNYDGVTLLIDKKCKQTINDYLYLKEASDQTKLKEKVKNPDTGVTYEKYGHTSDANDYFFCAHFAGSYEKFVKGDTTPKITIGKNISKNSY